MDKASRYRRLHRVQRMSSLLCVLCLWIAWHERANAQTGNQGSLGGVVRDPTEAVVAGAHVQARALATGISSTTTTNSQGLFQFPALAAGTYEVTIESQGFAQLALRSVEVSVGARLWFPLTLHLGRQSETITVQNATPLIETTRSQMSATVDSRSISSLPVNGRDFTSFALLQFGVTTDVRGGLSFGGQRAMNSLLVDGTSSDDNYWNQPIGGEGFPVTPGQSSYHLSLETVQEFQVNTSAYSAEFGRAGGGVVNVVTKSGTDQFHGTAFEFYRDRSLNANTVVNNLFGLPKDPFHFNQFGGVLGGPIVRNKLFFFTGYDGVRSVVANGVSLNLPPGFQLSSDPGTAAFQQRALDYLRPRAASWSFPLMQNDWLAKLDWQATPAEALSVHWIGQQLDSPFPGSPQESREHAMPTGSSIDIVAASLTSTLSPTLVNVARFAFVAGDEPFRAAGFTPEANVFEQGVLVLTIGRAPGMPQDVRNRRQQVSDTTSWVNGRHTFRFGADLFLDDITYFNAQNFTGSFRFLSLASFGESLAGTPSTQPGEFFRQSFSGFGTPGVTTHPDSNQYAVFLQDEWLPRPGLTLNAGLRYDLQAMGQPTVTNPSPELAAIGLDTSFRPVDPTNLAPRLGIAWAPRKNNRIVLRLGYGLFYAPTPSILAARAHFLNGVSVQPRIFEYGTPGAALIPAYPSTVCGLPDPSGVPPSCPPPSVGATKPLLMLFSPTYREPYTQQGSLGVEFAPQADFSVSLGYMVVKGTHLQWVRDINLALPLTPATIGIANTPTMLTYLEYALPRPMADFDRVSLFDSSANSIFHGLFAQLNKRFSNDFQFLLSYTLSKTIDDNPNVYAINPGGGDFQLLSDPLHPQTDRSAGVNDQRHRFVLSGVWQLNHVRSLPSVERAILGGWQIGGILTAQTGQPYSGLVNFDLNNDGNFATDRTPGLGRNTFYLPRTVSLDLRLMRSLPLGERLKLQILGEGFNLLNHANVTDVNRTQFAVIDSPSICGIAGIRCLVPQNTGIDAFGTPAASAGPRIIQLGAKFVF
jgi:outer membrane receptor protein involved in Fe transport